MSVESKIKGIIATVLGVSVDDIQDDTAIGDFSAWDSLNHLQIIRRIESEYSIKFTPDIMMDLEDVGDIVRATEARIK